ncbi:MAG: NADH:ubiquinone oxidoreductase [Tenuifilum sp.]|uniref:NADH-quinone oxidoreductase subunit B family protein n=1 Tax=Tenuifilum sp. TaxID=2760880 RepID=UPI001B764FD4|nr:NADH:ubiquinone oxidoreductase [Bacteroidales bacterium]HOK61223.1 NADH:ubiquinone oxidoreductase [Tenuifilum sp.]MBP9029053.1 NADH:ubiquinone oxidoreductase [Bacteroidales bacterium]HOK85253.1 NADH:ubiquinone oxidoreductase [Tenuifilum sp.]HON70685.1 NADH:ubiquinone oxidoreductase [Tenuifilum sp.]
MLDNLKILYHQGKQFIPDVRTAKVPGIFRGRPIINSHKVNVTELVDLCPMNAISSNPVSIDLGKCTFCGECALRFPEKIKFTTDYKISTNERERLIVKEGDDFAIEVNPVTVRKEIRKIFGKSLKLRQVSAGGDNSCEWELNAANNVQFDMSRFGIEFVASPRHADGIAITGPITQNMAKALEIAYNATPDPKVIVLIGTDAISGGIFADSPALDRSFLENHRVDLYIPGNPAHPLTIINGLLDLTRKKK